MSPSLGKAFPFLLLLSFLFAACGGGGNSLQPPPAPPSFTSTPVTSAAEGVQYSYQLAATSPDSSPITFSLTTAPSGATLSGSTVSWTPAHTESRVSNSFTATATTARGASATQSWTVTPKGTVNIFAVTTFWTPSGTSSRLPTWLTNLPYPAALVPQSDGSLQRLQGSANADGSFSIPDVPGGYYWLQFNPDANYWTPTSDFDFGRDVIGRPLSTIAQSPTTFTSSISGIIPSPNFGDYFFTQTDLDSSISPALGLVLPNSATFNSTFSAPTDIDWSTITTLYLSQYQHTVAGNFTGYILGPTQTLSNVSFTNGATNTITGTLAPSPTASIPLNITGSAWAGLAASSGPGNPTVAASDFAAFVEPYVTDRSATTSLTFPIGPAFALLRPSNSTGLFPLPHSYACRISIALGILPPLALGNSPIVTDTDYGSISYGDPYPSSWQRYFEYCQLSNVTVPRPNSTTTDTFSVGTEQITPLPLNGPVTPILSSVQSPMLNGSSLFTSVTLNTTNVTISWTAPAIGQPFGYFVAVYELVTNPTGTISYASAGVYATAKTSVSIPFLSANNTYVFAILAVSDSIASIELAPLRRKVPTARSAIVSAPFVIAPGATAATLQ